MKKLLFKVTFTSELRKEESYSKLYANNNLVNDCGTFMDDL